MRLRFASCSGRRFPTSRACSRTARGSTIGFSRGFLTALVAVGASLVVLVAVAEPATGATPDPSVAVPEPAQTLGGSADPNALPTPTPAASVPVPSTPTPSPPSFDSDNAATVPPPASQTAPEAAVDGTDTALAAAVSSAVPENAALERPLEAGDTADTGTAAVPTTAPASDPAGHESPVTRDTGTSATRTAPPSAPTAAQRLATRVTKPAASKPQRRIAPTRHTQYHPATVQYRLRNAAVDFARANAVPHHADTSPNVSQVPPAIPHHICAQIACHHPGSDVPAAPSGDSGTTAGDALPAHDPAPETNPLDELPVSSALGTIGAGTDCGNTNVSVRISSPGDDAPVSQAASAGDCGRNTNISVRINSPGDNGPVSQTVRVATPSERLAALPTAGWRTRPLVDPAGAGSGLPRVGVDPMTLPGRLDRSARRLANSLVAKAQTKAGLRPQRKAAPRKPGTTSKSTMNVRAFSRAQSSAGGSTAAAASASVALTASQQTLRARARALRARARAQAAKATASRRLPRLVPTPTDELPQVRSAGDSGFGVEAMLIAFLAALAASYLLIPPLGAGRGGVPSLFAKSKRALLRR
jgi:hypothetical protein